MFPNGYYFTLGGFTGYSNLIHVKPSVTLKPLPKLSLMAALGLQWRETAADAVYTQPVVAVSGTAGHGSLWSGAYGQFAHRLCRSIRIWPERSKPCITKSAAQFAARVDTTANILGL